jgi:hypothetical protein
MHLRLPGTTRLHVVDHVRQQLALKNLRKRACARVWLQQSS